MTSPYDALVCRVCGRVANPLYDGVCIACLDLQDELDEHNADSELASDPRYYQ